MLHSASKNHTRVPRVITNPPAALKEPFKFNRENPDELSLVEKKTLNALGVDRLDFKYVISFQGFRCGLYGIQDNNGAETRRSASGRKGREDAGG